MPEGPHCLKCRHQRACVLPQKQEGRVCGWYNARVERLITRTPQRVKITTQPR